MYVKINGRDYGILSRNGTAKYLTFEINGYTDLDDLAQDCRNHTGDFVVMEHGEVLETYKGYGELYRVALDVLGHIVTVTFAQVFNDEVALETLVGERISVAAAEVKRTEIETLASFADDTTAEEHAWAFPAWATGIAYVVGQRVRYNDLLYKCIQAHTSQDDWTPDAAVSLWVRTSDPGEEWPEWIQPTGAHDAYQTGDKVSYNEKHWVSTVDANVWEPGVYGWEESA